MSTNDLIQLIPFEPDNDIHVETLIQQRILCGWAVESVEAWREQARRQVKGLYWIMPQNTPEAKLRLRGPPPVREKFNRTDGLGPPAPYLDFRPLGHVSLDWEDYDGDESLGNKDEGICSLAAFYILGSQQGLGLGNIVMRELETKAVEIGAKEITLNTLCGIAGKTKELWASIGVEMDPNVRLMEPWYTRLGYVPYKREPRYKEPAPDGSIVKLQAVFMRKVLR
ncbi:uncharacterized protein JCM15063_003659 [Sporobolomyces koalae]|uniref:uncharacterized protein n=1 Tax=Sporobolomyces koalae TaxID=500713 RepID=UPI00317B8DCB